jgi:4-hydroxybenzoate polyprenyltransferase
VGLCYGLALLLWGAACWLSAGVPLALAALFPMALHLGWQVGTLREDGADPLVKFRSNRAAGLLMFLGCLAVGMA